MIVKVMTYNIQHCRNHNLEGDVIDYENTAAPILANMPDIVGLNEVRCGTSEPYYDQPTVIGSLTGMKPIFERSINVGGDPEKGYGNAVLTNLRVLSHEKIDIPDPCERIYPHHYEHRSILKIKIMCEETPVTFLVTHFGLNPDELKNAVDTVIDCVKNIDTPIILMGDFNAQPSNPEIRRFSEYLNNACEELSCVENTFPSHDPKICIDQMWYRGIRPTEINTYKGIYSDHLPLVASFEI